jgi:hypothetical protein
MDRFTLEQWIPKTRLEKSAANPFVKEGNSFNILKDGEPWLSLNVVGHLDEYKSMVEIVIALNEAYKPLEGMQHDTE